MDYRWIIKPPGNPAEVGVLTDELGIHPMLANLLVQRGINSFETARAFFRPNLDDLHDPFLMQDMATAIDRIENALEAGEKIMVYGDYDVDGTTAVSLVYSFFREETAHIDFYIPDRYTEGYGISFKGIDQAKAQGCTLIIALDCGIKAIEQVAYANQHGIDFIICDHHLPGETLPDAVAVLDPKRPDCNYPYDNLCGCGIGFKLLQAFCQRYDYRFERLLPSLDLVAIAIAADIVPIDGENRILAYHGLRQVNAAPRAGIRMMRELAKSKKEMTITDLVFVVGPRINAAGRMDHGRNAVKLLTTADLVEVETIAKSVDDSNTQRRGVDQDITTQALQRMQEDQEVHARFSTVLYDPQWHKGVIGIVASRLMENYYRPTILLTGGDGIATGSARSIKNFNIYEGLKACSDLLEEFGGHQYAAGLKVKEENIPAFIQRFEEVVRERVTQDDLVPTLIADGELDLSGVTPKFYRILRQMAPFGPGNRTPVFLSKKLIDAGKSRLVGSEKDHLKLDVAQANNKTCRQQGIAFGMGHHYHKMEAGNTFDALYCIDENEWQGQVSIQLRVKDIKFN